MVVGILQRPSIPYHSRTSNIEIGIIEWDILKERKNTKSTTLSIEYGEIAHYKKSMLQDLEAGNPLEPDSIELDTKLGLATPHAGSINKNVKH